MKKLAKKLKKKRFTKCFRRRFGRASGRFFGRSEKFAAVILSAFLFSCIISIHIIKAPVPLENYDGSGLRQIAASELGNEGGEKYWSWCGFDERVEWCACFVSWCLSRCYGAFPKISSCNDFIRFIKENNGWYGRDTKPVPGMIVFFDFDGDKNAEHMGIADRFVKNKIYVIEGNSGDRCELNVYAPEDKSVLGYGAVLPVNT